MPKVVRRVVPGEVFGRLVVLNIPEGRVRKTHVALWCRCSCGKTVLVPRCDLLRERTRSCGCQRREKARERALTCTQHGHASKRSSTPTYRTWSGMKRRCCVPSDRGFKNYGGRGIQVCHRWREFGNFLRDMGVRPSGSSLGRIDNDGPYSPENCRWERSLQQAENRRTTVWVTWKGRRMALSAFVRNHKVPYQRTWKRIKKGWTLGEAINTPAWARRK